MNAEIYRQVITDQIDAIESSFARIDSHSSVYAITEYINRLNSLYVIIDNVTGLMNHPKDIELLERIKNIRYQFGSCLADKLVVQKPKGGVYSVSK